MASSAKVTFEPIEGLKPQSKKPRILFLEGVPDDSMIKLTSPVPAQGQRDNILKSLSGYESATVLKRMIPDNLNHHVSLPGCAHDKLVLVPEEGQVYKAAMADVIVNLMINPDTASKALRKAEKLIAEIQAQSPRPIPVVNAPEAILRTTRDAIYDQFKDLPGLTIPLVARIKPNSVAEVIQKVKAAGITTPFLYARRARTAAGCNISVAGRSRNC